MAANCLHLCIVAFCAETVGLAGPTNGKAHTAKPRVCPGVRRAIVVKNDGSGAVVLRTAGRTWRTNIAANITEIVKNGVPVGRSAFPAGSEVVVLSGYYDFDPLNTLTDRASYAAYFHDDVWSGDLKSADLTDRSVVLLLHGSGPTDVKKPPSSIEQDFRYNTATQLWLNGQRQKNVQAMAGVQPGTRLNLAYRYQDYRRAGKYGPRHAYAIFDDKSWRQFAESELRHRTDLYQPSKPTYAHTKD